MHNAKTLDVVKAPHFDKNLPSFVTYYLIYIYIYI